MTTSHSFSTQYNVLVNTLKTEVHLAQAFDPDTTNPHPQLNPFIAIWDTGATNSVITQNVIAKCNLKPIGRTMVRGVHGAKSSETFFVNIRLPNMVGFAGVRVTEGTLIGDADVLIGMDIISQGDFALTHHDGKTLLSFRYPSIGNIDFVKHKAAGLKVARSAPCPCGSGKKYKRCCGK